MNIEKPKVSVCMITYNHEAYVGQAIESVLSQISNFKYELVIGEDCSQDRTRVICAEYLSQRANIVLLEPTENLGLMQNFIRTLQACQGEYIAICEGDDYWTDTLKLQKQIDFLEQSPEYAGSAHQALVMKDGRESGPFKSNVPETISITDVVRGRLFHTASIVFRRRALELLVGSPLVYSGDRLLNFCICLNGNIHFRNDCMCVYRIHGSGASTNSKVTQLLKDLDCISYIKEIYPSFPRYAYASYVYATVGLCNNASIFQKLYYISISALFSFSYFPNNIAVVVKYMLGALRRNVRFGKHGQPLTKVTEGLDK